MFTTDSQTWADLQIFSSIRSRLSIASIFDKEVSSLKGKEVLNEMFRYPLSSKEEIESRASLIRHFSAEATQKMKIYVEALDFMEYYLTLDQISSRYSFVDGLRKYIGQFFKADNDYYVIKRSISCFVEVVEHVYLFAKDNCSSPGSIGKLSGRIVAIVEQCGLNKLIWRKDKKLSFYEIEKFDHQLRYSNKEQVRELLEIIYQIDVYQAAAAVVVKHGFVFAELTDGVMLDVKGLYHPLLSKPVANDIRLDKESNIAFITGANMAGKSTFMKALGIAVYLAHMGFPIPAKSMRFSICNGLYSSINVPDDLSLGYSHFYAEVKRIKLIAQQMDGSKSFVVLFDELFRGTNVKDAYEATVAIIKAFSKVKNTIFIFSSHILEAAEELNKEITGIQFLRFQTELTSEGLSYSYLMSDGISNDRFGMYIIRKEGIEEILGQKT